MLRNICKKKVKIIRGSILSTIGYILSPLSCYNDLVVNIPIAYLLSLPFSQFGEGIWTLSFITAYIFTNWLGFYLMGKGIEDFTSYKIDIKKDLILSIIYVLIVYILIKVGILPNFKTIASYLKK